MHAPWDVLTRMAELMSIKMPIKVGSKQLSTPVYMPYTCILYVSDETFYAQSQIMVENVPEFSAESLCLRQGVLTS